MGIHVQLPYLQNLFRENSGRELLSNHLGYLVTTSTTRELRACALSMIKPLGSMTSSLSLKNWENLHHPFG